MVGKHFSLVLLALYLVPVSTFSTGAGGCNGSEAAVSGFHLDTTNGRSVSSNSLEAAGVGVRIDDEILVPGVPLNLTIGRDLTIAIESIQFPMRGILIRIEAPGGVDTTGILAPGTGTKAATVCEAPIVGVTQIDNSDKTALSGTLRFDKAVMLVVLDVTVVFSNSAEVSAYTYSQYSVNFVESNIDEMMSHKPSPAPFVAPVGTPVGAPMSKTGKGKERPPRTPRGMGGDKGKGKKGIGNVEDEGNKGSSSKRSDRNCSEGVGKGKGKGRRLGTGKEVVDQSRGDAGKGNAKRKGMSSATDCNMIARGMDRTEEGDR